MGVVQACTVQVNGTLLTDICRQEDDFTTTNALGVLDAGLRPRLMNRPCARVVNV